MNSGTARVFVAELDSVETRRTYERAADPGAAQRDLVAAIRVASIVGGTVLLTPAMLFDSFFFTSVGPERLSRMLGCDEHALPFTLLLDSLGAGAELERLKQRPDMRWQLSGRDQVDRWWEATDRADIRAGWDRWVRAIDQERVLSVEFVDTTRKRPAMVSDLAALPVPRSGPLADFQELAVSALQTARRSPVFDAHEAVVDQLGAADRAVADDIRRRWNDAYFGLLATQHEAAWLKVRGGKVSEHRGRDVIRVSSAVVDTVGAAPASVFAHMAFMSQKQRSDVVRGATPRRTRALVFALEQAVSSRSLPAALADIVARVALPLVVIFLAAPHLTVFETGEGQWVLFAALVLATVPWPDVVAWWSARPGKLDLAISVSRGD